MYILVFYGICRKSSGKITVGSLEREKMKTLFLERGGIGDLLFRIPYYDLLLDHDSVVLCSKRDKSVLDYFLPGRNIFPFNADWFLLDPLYRRKILKKTGGSFENAIISMPYYHEKMYRVCQKVPAKKKYVFWEHGKGPVDSSFSLEFIQKESSTVNHYSQAVHGLFLHAGYSLPNNWAPFLFFREWRNKNKLGNKKESKPYIVFQPDAGVFGKRWPEENWKLLAGLFSSSYSISVVGEVSCDLGGVAYRNNGLRSGIWGAFGEVLGASFFIGNDTGFTHLAYLSGIPTVFIAGGGEYGRFCPWENYNETYGHTIEWVSARMDCFGCGWECRYGDYRKITPPCIKNISVKDVEKAIGNLAWTASDLLEE